MQTRGGPGKCQPQDRDVVSGRAVNRCQMMVGVLTRCESNARPSYARRRRNAGEIGQRGDGSGEMRVAVRREAAVTSGCVR